MLHHLEILVLNIFRCAALERENAALSEQLAALRAALGARDNNVNNNNNNNNNNSISSISGNSCETKRAFNIKTENDVKMEDESVSNFITLCHKQ